MEDNPFSKTLKTPSPPAKMKLFLESFDNNFNNRASVGYTSENSNHNDKLNHQPISQLNLQPQFDEVSSNQLNTNQQQTTNHQQANQQQMNAVATINLNKTTDENAFKTDDYKLSIKPLSTESNGRPSLTCRSRLGNNTGDALTGIVKKYRELQAKSKVSLVLDDSTDEESNNEDLSDTPSFRCSSDEEEFSSQCTDSLESSSNLQKKGNKNMKAYKSEPQLSSFENSDEQSMNGGMCQDSIRYHSHNALKKSASIFETVTVCDVNYFILDSIGEGGSSKVYHVCNEKKQFFALKVVDLSKMNDSLKSLLKKEIEILNMLKGCKRVIQLYAYEMNKSDEKLMLVMEKGDTDLGTVLSEMIRNDSKKRLDLTTIKHYWSEMLKAVDEIHKKGIVHSDLKPVNFVIVKGYLKLIDFGIADAIDPDQTSVVKSNLVGTINYMSPESLMSQTNMSSGKKEIKVKCKSDVWSLGCILYNMCYGKTPFGHIDQLVAKIQAICDPGRDSKTKINFPPFSDPDAVDCMKRCLVRDIKNRASVEDLLKHPFLPGNKPTTSKLPATTSRLYSNKLSSTSAARTPPIEKRLIDLCSDANKLTPRSFQDRFKNVMRAQQQAKK